MCAQKIMSGKECSNEYKLRHKRKPEKLKRLVQYDLGVLCHVIHVQLLLSG